MRVSMPALFTMMSSRPNLLDRRIDELLEIGKLAYVGLDADGLVAELGDLPLQCLGRLRMNHVVDDDAGTLARQFNNDRLTDPAVAAGDDRDLVLQRHDQPLNIPCGIASHSSGIERLVMSLKNKVAIVTGGNSGIGQAIVLELARQGASIVIDYVAHPEATEALERQIANSAPSPSASRPT